MKKLLFSLLSLLCLTLSALQKDLVLRFDFDNPEAIGGTSFELPLPPGGNVPGKFGNGYYFQRSSFNFLPPEMAEPASAKFFRSLPETKHGFMQKATITDMKRLTKRKRLVIVIAEN